MIILESLSGGKLGVEEQAIYDEFQDPGWGVRHEVVCVPLKHLQRRKFIVPEYDVYILSGSIDFVETALKQLNKPLPQTCSYPASISPWLHRSVRFGTVADLTDLSLPLFIKPRESAKKFTGFVCREADDYRLRAVGKNTPLLISDVVNWITEWRYYCFSPNVNFNAHYSGDPTVSPLAIDVYNIITSLGKDTVFPTVIDIGVLSTGETAVVEVNDAYSVGFYGEAKGLYTHLIAQRWKSLSQCSG